jgi:hypothetical protein
MAQAHEAWVAELLAGLDEDDIAGLMAGLSRVKHSVLDAIRDEEGGGDG